MVGPDPTTSRDESIPVSAAQSAASPARGGWVRPNHDGDNQRHRL